MLTLLTVLGSCALLPSLLGWQPVVVVSGSMSPQVAVGDVLVAQPLPAALATPARQHGAPDGARLRRGQILLVDNPDAPGQLLSHRLMRLNPDGTLVLRGDANQSADSTPVPRSAVRGVMVLRVPWIGLPVIWRTVHDRTPLAASLLALLAAVTLTARGPARADLAPARRGQAVAM